MKQLAPDSPCPCGGVVGGGESTAAAHPMRKASTKSAPTQNYGQCCGRWLEADAILGAVAPDAQQLMRSRYTAFALEREAYLLATWHPSQRPAQIVFEPGVKWLGLEVRAARSTGADSAEVEFVARYRMDGRAVRVHERSRFLRIGERWFYVDGDAL